MNTAEMALEQLLAGMLTLVVLFLPFVDPWADPAVLSRVHVLAAMVGAAYLLGAVFDKIYDAILGGAEQWARLRHVDAARADGPRPDDPFAQDRIEARLRGHEGALARMNSLRSRIRLTRTLAVLAPLIAVSLVVWDATVSAHWTGGPAGVVRVPHSLSTWILAVWPGLVLALAWAFAAFLPPLPRTWEWADPARPRQPLRSRLHAFTPVAAVSVFTLVFWACIDGHGKHAGVLAVGLALGWTSLWSWWRVQRTYFRFLASHDGLQEAPRPSAP
jgi:hypothetical protein